MRSIDKIDPAIMDTLKAARKPLSFTALCDAVEAREPEAYLQIAGGLLGGKALWEETITRELFNLRYNGKVEHMGIAQWRAKVLL